jgi:hypothetical protein
MEFYGKAHISPDAVRIAQLRGARSRVRCCATAGWFGSTRFERGSRLQQSPVHGRAGRNRSFKRKNGWNRFLARQYAENRTRRSGRLGDPRIGRRPHRRRSQARDRNSERLYASMHRRRRRRLKPAKMLHASGCLKPQRRDPKRFREDEGWRRMEWRPWQVFPKRRGPQGWDRFRPLHGRRSRGHRSKRRPRHRRRSCCGELNRECLREEIRGQAGGRLEPARLFR